MLNTDFDPNGPEAKRCQSQPVGVADCHRSPTNPRKRFPAEGMAELTDSVRTHGVIQPIIVRPWPADQAYQSAKFPMWEVVAGERRWRAATAAEIKLIPAVVRDLTDAQVVELQLIENLQREDVLPTEEAEGYRRMIDEHGYSADQLADKIHKSRAYIYGRLKLLALCPEVRASLDAGELAASIALVIARLPVRLQSGAARVAEGQSYRVAFDTIRHRYHTDLATATWDLADAELVPTAGPCHGCLYNESGAGLGKNVCMNTDCFGTKRKAALERDKAAAKAQGKAVIDGKAAQKLMPYGWLESSAPVVKLDDYCPEAPRNEDGTAPTYREVLAGRDVPVTLLEDQRNEQLVETVERTAMADALQEAGIRIAQVHDHREEQKKQEAKRKAEATYRRALLAEIRTAQAAELEGCTAPKLDDNGLRLLTRALWFRAWSDTKNAVAGFYQEAGGKLTTADIVADLDKRIETMTPAELIQLATTVALAPDIAVHTYASDFTTPAPLLDTARDYLIDPVALKKALKAPSAAGKKGAPPTKAPRGRGNDATQAAAAAQPPTEAARAAGTKRKGKKEQAADAAREEENSGRAGPAGEDEGGADEADPLYSQAVHIVTEHQRPSISLVQRELRIGYNRAARLIEAMEQQRVVSTPDASGVRTLIAGDRCPNTQDIFEGATE